MWLLNKLCISGEAVTVCCQHSKPVEAGEKGYGPKTWNSTYNILPAEVSEKLQLTGRKEKKHVML